MNGSKRKGVHVANGGTKQSVWSRAFRAQATWDDKILCKLDSAIFEHLRVLSLNGENVLVSNEPNHHACKVLREEFLDVIYWFRQIIAVILGVILGIVPLTGFLGIATFCAVNAGVLYLYFNTFQQIDEEEYGGTWELTKEGFMTSFALFLQYVVRYYGVMLGSGSKPQLLVSHAITRVTWIIFYTAIHHD